MHFDNLDRFKKWLLFFFFVSYVIIVVKYEDKNILNGKDTRAILMLLSTYFDQILSYCSRYIVICVNEIVTIFALCWYIRGVIKIKFVTMDGRCKNSCRTINFDDVNLVNNLINTHKLNEDFKFHRQILEIE